MEKVGFAPGFFLGRVRQLNLGEKVMAKKIEVPALTRAARLGAKTQATDDAARVIVEAEAAKRDAKTLRLRAARLKAEAETPAAVVQKHRKGAAKQ